jgi:hypothetical protein
MIGISLHTTKVTRFLQTNFHRFVEFQPLLYDQIPAAKTKTNIQPKEAIENMEPIKIRLHLVRPGN